MRPFSLGVLAVICAPFVSGQAFQGLSTPDDGSVLYFSSPDRLVGSGESLNSKIFRWDAANGFQLVADVPDPGTFDGCTYPHYYELSAPQVSASGTVLAYSASRPPSASRYCSPAEPNQGIVQGKTLPGSIALSPNGRYAITMPLNAVTNEYHVVTDLLSGTSTIVSGAFNGDRQRITDEGAIVTPSPSAILLTDRNGGTRIFPTKMQVNELIIDRAGKTLIYLTRLGPNNPGAISVIDVSSGKETQIFTGFAPDNLSLTADGSTLLFTNNAGSGPLPYLIDVDGANQRQIGTAAVADALLSGDGKTIYANSTDARLLRIDVASGAATELAPATPLIAAFYRPYPPATTIAAAGSVVSIYGSGFTDLKQVTFCDRAASVQFQVPWNLPDQTCNVIVETASPFESVATLTVQQYDPQFIAGGLVVHGDFSGPITSSSPAHPGETIVAYMTGLGPVDQNGLLTRAGFVCRFDSIPANVPYAGLAPGFVGVYQINMQVPDVKESSASLACGWDPFNEAATSVWMGPN